MIIWEIQKNHRTVYQRKRYLTHSEKRALKDIFQTAQDNESVMWQTVISFDNRWLEQNGIYDSQKQILDEQKLKEVTRLAVNRLLKSEGLEHAVWSAGIHYNTDNFACAYCDSRAIPDAGKK